MAELKDDPGEKMRALLAGGKNSPLGRLPKKANGASFVPLKKEEKRAGTSTESEGDSPSKGVPKSETPHASPEHVSPSTGKKFNFRPAFWTIASVLSLTINVIVLIVLLAVLQNMRTLKLGSAMGGAMELGNGLLGGLYTNFEKMDNAHITKTIPVNTTIPVKFDLQLNQQTNVVLSQNVTINRALVTVNTGGLNITNALATIVLPEGTTLPVYLNLTVPVDTTVPVVLDVAVDIPLAETQLHEPFSGLQEVVKPYYCMVNPAALKLNGQPVCE
jgi:hypothetical protein